MNQSVAYPSPLVDIDAEQYQVQIEMIYAMVKDGTVVNVLP